MLRKKRFRGNLAKYDGDFVQNQESQLLEDEGFVLVKNQNVNKFPKLNQESFAHVPEQKSHRSEINDKSSTISSQSSDDIFQCKSK